MAASDNLSKQIIEQMIPHLTDDLRREQYRGHECPTAGHCYVASEVLYHMLGGAASGYKPMNIFHEGSSHWFLKHSSGEIIDPTADQFKTPVPYEKAKGKGFMTRYPSNRAGVVMTRMKMNKK